VGDALSHAVLPGAAIGYLISGMSLVASLLAVSKRESICRF
jgi:ABC-type Mn2+/Zn2+ transport system permease subunit